MAVHRFTEAEKADVLMACEMYSASPTGVVDHMLGEVGLRESATLKDATVEVRGHFTSDG